MQMVRGGYYDSVDIRRSEQIIRPLENLRDAQAARGVGIRIAHRADLDVWTEGESRRVDGTGHGAGADDSYTYKLRHVNAIIPASPVVRFLSYK
jgi:hypothetical protein